MFSKPKAVIFDLDGTIADLTHRLPLVKGHERNWSEFFKRVGEDTLIEDVAGLIKRFRDHMILLCSGRSDECRETTEAWLKRHEVFYDKLFMRRAGDHRPDWLIKKEIYRDFIEPEYRVRYVFDDRDQVVSMWRQEGLRCLQVANGSF